MAEAPCPEGAGIVIHDTELDALQEHVSDAAPSVTTSLPPFESKVRV